jgi:tetratricopeptide (TPR) repeat protein
MIRVRLLAVFALLVALQGAAVAADPEAEKLARRSFERAEAHFNAGLFAEALAEYRAGYEQMPLPGFLINIAQCQRRLGDLAQARTTYEKFLMVAPDSPYVPEVKSLIVELDKLLEASKAQAKSAAKPAPVPPRDEAKLEPPPQPVPTPSPELAADELSDKSLVEAPDISSPPETGTRWWLWGTIGSVVAVGAGVAAYLLWPAKTTTLHEGTLGTLRR